MNREEFEKLSEIKSILKENPEIKFEDGGYIYYGLNTITALSATFVGGAWYAYQEQWKKMTQAYITLGEALNNTPDSYEDAIREAMDDLK